MTRTYALKRLLEHGPLTMREIVRITRWTSAQVGSALFGLEKSGLLDKEKARSYTVYRLAD